MRVKVIHPFYDMENKKYRIQNEEFEVSESRLKVLQGDNPYKVKFVEIIEEVLTADNIIEAIEETKEDLVSKPKKKK